MRISPLKIVPVVYLVLVMLCISALFSLGCSRDPEQRAAYKQFLEELLPREAQQPLPPLTVEQTAAFGPYALSYQALYDFNRKMTESVDGCAKHMTVISENVYVPRDIVGHMSEIAAAREYIADQPALWEEDLAALEAFKADLHLHADVAPLYELLYTKYTEPARRVVPLLHAMQDFLDSNLELARFLSDNADAVEFQGNTIVFNDAPLQEQANAILANINTRARELYWRENELNEYILLNRN